MANPEHIPPAAMAAKLGVGRLTRHVLLCAGPDCVASDAGERTWEYFKRRLKELELAGPEGTCYRTKCHCLRVCIDGPICVVYPEGAWYRNVTPENAERILQSHVLGGQVVEDLCFARNPLPGEHCPKGDGKG
jgi:(2Fe-2S) ferredoxin